MICTFSPALLPFMKTRGKVGFSMAFLFIIIFSVCFTSIRREVSLLSFILRQGETLAARNKAPQSSNNSAEIVVKSTGETTTTTTTTVRSKADDDEYRHQHAGKTKTIPVEPSDYIYQDVWSAPIVIESHKLVFFQVAKVGTSMWKRLFRRMMGEPDWHDAMPHDPNTNGLKFLNQYSLQEATYMMNSPDYTRAIFVRDPKDRLLSAFLNKVKKDYQKYGKQSAKQCCSTNNDETCMERFRTFGGFVDAIHVCTNNCCDDVHWKPQASRLDEKFYPNIDFVGHLETAHDDAKRLLQRIGAWEEFGKSGWGQYGNESFLTEKSDVGHSTNAGDRRAEYFAPELEAIVEEMYAADYSVFDLPKHRVNYSSCLQESPYPVILMSKGRSGSTVLWTTLTNLTGYETFPVEVTGGNPEKSRRFFSKVDEQGEWLVKELCRLQSKHPQASMVGFKWKPHGSIFTSNAVGALKRLAKEGIKVIYSERNPLDVMISNHKHSTTNNLEAHCADTSCVRAHVSSKVNLPTDDLVQKLKSSIGNRKRVVKMLSEHQVLHMHVSYENLFIKMDTTDWERMLDFVGLGRSVTTAQVLHAAKYQKTSSKHHNATLENYETVKLTLSGTQFESLMH